MAFKINQIPLIILNVIIIIISIYLVFLFFKSKTFHKYPCYNMIIFSFIILFDCIFRIIPINYNSDNCIKAEKVIAYFIVMFDKLILATLSMQSVIYYLGALKINFYSTYEAIIFFTTFICSLVISGSLAGLYISDGFEAYDLYCYSTSTSRKKTIDTIFNSVYLIINLYCSIVTLRYISRKKQEVENGLIDDLNYNHHFNRLLIMLILNVFTFTESYLIIHDVLTGDYLDLLYLITCLVVDLFYCINEEVYKETLKIFCKKKYNQKYNVLKTKKTNFDDDDDD